MDDEEPSAASAISAAANKGQHVALQEHEWTALSTLNGFCIPYNGEFSEDHLWQQFHDRAMDVLGVDGVQNSLFKYVVMLVHQLRGKQQSYVTDLVQFGETMVDSKKRRCTFNLYKTACGMNDAAPECKVAMIKKQYSLKPDENRFIPNPPDGWRTVRPDWLQQLEVMLRYLKKEDVRSALAASIPQEPGTNAPERQLRQIVVEMNLMVVTTFEKVTFETYEKVKSSPKSDCNVHVVQRALVAAARETFVKYQADTLVPPPPQGQEWLDFAPTAQAAKKDDPTAKAKAKGRPKKEEGPQMPQ